jgi:anti-sigma factor RsiW
MSCKEFVELVTDYLENALSADERQRFEEHLALCPGCVTYVEQIRQTVATTGALREESLAPVARDKLLAAFRDWNRN